MPLLADLARIIQPGEGLAFDIQRNGDALVVLLQPRLKAPVKETDTDDAAGQLRAALAMPLRIVGDAATLDAELPAKLREYARARTGLTEQVGALEALREAGKAADRLADKERQKQAKGAAKPAAQTAPAKADEGASVTAPDDAGATGSLFD